MRNLLLKLVILQIAIVFGSSIIEANGTLEFEITSEKVSEAWYYRSNTGQYQIYVKLKEPYRKFFSKLTEDNIGEKIKITLSDRILISPVVRGGIDSGIIQIAEFDNEEEAKKFSDKFFPNLMQKEPLKY